MVPVLYVYFLPRWIQSANSVEEIGGMPRLPIKQNLPLRPLLTIIFRPQSTIILGTLDRTIRRIFLPHLDRTIRRIFHPHLDRTIRRIFLPHLLHKKYNFFDLEYPTANAKTYTNEANQLNGIIYLRNRIYWNMVKRFHVTHF